MFALIQPLQGFYQIQGGPKLGFGGPPGTPSDLVWNNLSEQMTAVNAAPAWDLNVSYVASSSDVTGTSVEMQNNVTEVPQTEAGAGLWDAIRFHLGQTPSAFLTAWNPATQALAVRGTIVTRPAASAAMYVGFSWANDNARQALGMRAFFYQYTAAAQDRVSGLLVTWAAPEIRAATLAGLTAGTHQAPCWVSPGDLNVAANNSLSGFTTVLNPPQLDYFAGCQSNTSSGPHTMKILWEYAFVPIGA